MKYIEKSTAEMVEKLKISTQAVCKKAKKNKLPPGVKAKKIGHYWMFKMSEETWQNL